MIEVADMAVDISKMPKLGFGLMRLPTNGEEIDLDAVCRMSINILQQG